MKASIEISLYPLSKNYKEIVSQFILKIRQYPELTIETNGMSTQIFGDYDTLIQLLQVEIKGILSIHPSIFVLKIAAGHLTAQNLPAHLS